MRRAAALLLGLSACVIAGQARLRAAPPSPGERAYQKCYSCHSLEGPDPTTQGPSLRGIVGRRVASEPGFRYSPFMRAYAERQETWDRAALDAFIADPQAVVPDNEMGFFGIADPAERQALIDYLERSGG